MTFFRFPAEYVLTQGLDTKQFKEMVINFGGKKPKNQQNL